MASHRLSPPAILGENLSISLPLCDEYGDADIGNPPLLLHLILHECERYENSEDFLQWAFESGLDASQPLLRSIYQELAEKVPQIRGLVGDKLHPVNQLDFELDAGGIGILRKPG
jgi:hypothetical protein